MATTAPPPATTGSETPAWHVLSREGAVHELHVEPERGLTTEEAAARLAHHGPNKFAEAKTEPRWHAFLRQYQDPMQIVLLVAGVISIYPVKQPGTGIGLPTASRANPSPSTNERGSMGLENLITASESACRFGCEVPETTSGRSGSGRNRSDVWK